MLDRRGFLIGAGGLLTAAFVRRATAFSRKVGEPLVLPTARKPEETLYIYAQDSDPKAWVGRWRVSLGPNKLDAPPPPTWREHLRSLGHRLESEADIERICIQKGLEPQDLDAQVDGFWWEDMWDNFTGPAAKAYHLLKTLDLGDADSKLRQAGEIMFEGCGGGPGNTYTWVDLKDDLTVSLLQARLIELDLPINVKVGSWRDC
jgi:hypothetical protein